MTDDLRLGGRRKTFVESCRVHPQSCAFFLFPSLGRPQYEKQSRTPFRRRRCDSRRIGRMPRNVQTLNQRTAISAHQSYPNDMHAPRAVLHANRTVVQAPPAWRPSALEGNGLASNSSKTPHGNGWPLGLLITNGSLPERRPRSKPFPPHGPTGFWLPMSATNRSAAESFRPPRPEAVQ